MRLVRRCGRPGFELGTKRQLQRAENRRNQGRHGCRFRNSVHHDDDCPVGAVRAWIDLQVNLQVCLGGQFTLVHVVHLLGIR